MDSFFSQFLLLSEGTITLTAYGLLILGGFICSRLVTVAYEARRVVYLWQTTGIVAVLTLSGFTWILAGAAAEAGMLSVLIIANLSIYLAAGAGFYVASAARSNDISGSTNKAWLGFVPLAVLYLLLAPTQIPAHQRIKRTWASRFIADPILVIGALIVMGLTQSVSKALEDPAFYQSAQNSALQETLTASMTIEERFAYEAKSIQDQLPKKIDEVTTLTAFESEGKTLRLSYDVNQPIAGFAPAFKASIASQHCSPDIFLSELKEGASIVSEYWGPDANLIDAITVTGDDCI